MTRTDHRIIFTALGFLAVTLQEVSLDKQALRATNIARLIESFCIISVPNAFGDDYLSYSGPIPETEHLLETYIAELRDRGSARLPFDRQTLLRMYELLLIHKTRKEQKEFYASGHEDVIANRVLQLAEERLRSEEQA